MVAFADPRAVAAKLQQVDNRIGCPDPLAKLALKLPSIIHPCHILDEICRSKSLRYRQQMKLLRTISWRLTLGPIVQDRIQFLQI
jgi:hypothetical protein